MKPDGAQKRELAALTWKTKRNGNPVARLRWWLLPYIGYYCEGTEMWRWWMRPVSWLYFALGRVPGGGLYS